MTKITRLEKMEGNVEKKDRNRKDKDRSSHKRKRKKIFHGKRKQELEEELNNETLQEKLVGSGDAAVPSTSQPQQREKVELVPPTNKTVTKILDIDEGHMDSVLGKMVNYLLLVVIK